MNLKDAKVYEFPRVSQEEWQDAVVKSLKGKGIETLRTETYENILLEPLYFNREHKDGESPGQVPYTRGIYSDGYASHPLGICQFISGDTYDEVENSLRAAIEEGQNTLALTARALPDEWDYSELFNRFESHDLPWFIEARASQSTIMNTIGNQVEGAVLRDLIAEWAESGTMPKEEAVELQNWFSQVKNWAEQRSSLKSVMVDVKPYHEAGGDAVKEIAYALSVGSQYVWEGIQAGLSPEDVANQMIFSFAVDSVFFMQIAKLRAARRLWSAIGQGYQKAEQFKMNIHVQTTRRNKTTFDPHVNLLRTTNEAFAAVVGGCQYLTVGAFDELYKDRSTLGKRMARNIQHILQEESALLRTADPGGGSYYLETLTDQLCEKAWALFLEIEEQGGFLTALKKGTIQEALATEARARMEDVAYRRTKIVGVNVYANPDEKRPEGGLAIPKLQELDEASQAIVAVEPARLAAEYETIRSVNLVASYNQKGRIAILGIGVQPKYKPYMDFAKEILSSGGLVYTEMDAVEKVEDIADRLKPTACDHVIICGTEDELQGELTDLAVINNESRYFVGKFEKETVQTLMQAGWKKIDRHTNIIETLALLSSMGDAE